MTLPKLLVGAVAAVWWDDPAFDADVHDPAGAETLAICPKITVGVVVKTSRHDLWLAHEVFLDGTWRLQGRTVLQRRLITHIELLPGLRLKRPPKPRPKS